MIALIAVLLATLWVVIPIIGLVRAFRLQAEVARLAARVEQIEALLRAARADETSPETAPQPHAAHASAPASVRAATAGPVAVQPAVEFHQTASVDVEERAAVDLEERIGGRWLQHAGLVVLVLGVAFFLRYAFDREWLSPLVRVSMGAVAGTAMGAGGLWLARTYRAYGLLTAGAGVVVLYLAVYASLNLYGLVAPQAAFAVLVIVTAATAWISDRAGSQALGIMAVCGGFATPFLVGGDTDQQVTLFSYVGLLVAATMYLAHRRDWPWLNVVSLALTAFTVLAWASAHYAPARYLRTELFLTTYCAMFLVILRTAWRRAATPSAAVHLALLAFAPVGYHIWSVVTLAPHGLAFLVYLICATCAAVVAGVHYGSSLLRLMAWIGVALPLGAWIETYGGGSWSLAVVVTVGGVHAAHLAAQIRTVLGGEELDARDVTLLHANGVGLFAALHEVLQDRVSVESLATMAVGLAAMNAGIWWALRAASPVRALHWVAVAATLVAIAIWLQLGGPWAVATWAVEGGALFWIAAKAERPWLRAGAAALVALAIVRWLQPDIQATATSFVPVVNARALTGLAIVGTLYVTAFAAYARGTRGRERAAVVIAASLMTLAVISTDIVSFWMLRGTSADSVAGEMMLSASWVLYAAVLVAAGMRAAYSPIRYLAMALFGVSLLKIFLVDLGRVGGIYRVIGFLVIGVILVLVSFLYQRRPR